MVPGKQTNKEIKKETVDWIDDSYINRAVPLQTETLQHHVSPDVSDASLRYPDLGPQTYIMCVGTYIMHRPAGRGLHAARFTPLQPWLRVSLRPAVVEYQPSVWSPLWTSVA